MKDFSFKAPTQAVFGRGTENQVGKLLKQYGATKVLVQYGGGSVVRSGLLRRVTEAMDAEGIRYWLKGGVQPNPRLPFVKEAIALCRGQGVDFLLAVGAGSTIDSVKATSVGVPYEGDVWDFYTRKATPDKALPIGVVLTLPAAGSEGSNSSVITNPDGDWKRGLNTDIYRPAFAVYNPELTYTLPAYQTACGAVDIMSHTIERYFTNEEDNAFTDRQCEALLRAMIEQTPIALREPDNYAARANMMWASTISHNGLLDVGRQGDWSSHQLEHELSGIYDVAHGAGLAVTIPTWMKCVYRERVPRFCQFASRVFGIEADFEHPERTALRGIEALEGFFRSIGMPVRLSDLGIGQDRLEEMAKKCNRNNDGKLGFFVPQEDEGILRMFRAMV